MATTPTPLQLIERIPASAFLAIEAALPLLQRQQPQLADARIDVFGAGGAPAIVIARGQGAPVGVHLAPPRELGADEVRQAAAGGTQAPLLGTLQARYVRAVGVAIDAFVKQRPNVDLAGYGIELVGEGSSLIVLFADLQRPPGTRGSAGLPGFEVEMDSATLKVKRSNFVR